MGQPEQLIARVMARPDDGDAVFELMKEFHKGYPLERLLPLLQSPDAEVCRAGAWIASEQGTKGRPLFEYVLPLLHHSNKKVRFWAVDCILCWAEPANGAGIATVLPLLEDSEYAVRWKTMGFIARIAKANLEAALGHLNSADPHSPYIAKLAWLTGAGADGPEEVTSLLRSEDPVARKFAAAAAFRMARIDKEPLALAAAHSDPDVEKFASDMQGLI